MNPKKWILTGTMGINLFIGVNSVVPIQKSETDDLAFQIAESTLQNGYRYEDSASMSGKSIKPPLPNVSYNLLLQ